MVWAASQDDAQSTNLKALISSVGRTVMDAPDFVDRPVEVPQPVVQDPQVLHDQVAEKSLNKESFSTSAEPHAAPPAKSIDQSLHCYPCLRD